MGQPARLTLARQHEVRLRLTNVETHADLARSYAVGISTIQRIKKRWAQEAL